MHIRIAEKKDVVFIVEMLANDILGQQREDFRIPLPDSYNQAFEEIDSNSAIELFVVEIDGIIRGTFQISFIRDMTYQGGLRATIEAVRVHQEMTGQGIGEGMFHWAIQHAKEKGAHILQLTTDKQRPDAKRFYEKLGFSASHEGMKLKLI